MPLARGPSNRPPLGLLGPLALIPLLAGCAAFRNDLDGVPARYLAEEYRVESERGKKPINPALLGQPYPAEYRIDSGDVLTVFVEGVLGRPPEPPPIQSSNHPYDQPSTGYPITVRDDGTIALPYEGAIDVRGLSLAEVERKLRYFYTHQRPLLREGRSRVLVGLHRPRTHRVLVVRQESGNRQGNIGSGGTVNFEIDKRGTGRIVELPAYRNDVMHALAETGGLPGVDARNAVYVIRRARCRVAAAPEPAVHVPLETYPPHESWAPETEPDGLQPTVIWNPLAQRRDTRNDDRRGLVVRGQTPEYDSYRHGVGSWTSKPPSGGIVHADFTTTEPHLQRVVPAQHQWLAPPPTGPYTMGAHAETCTNPYCEPLALAEAGWNVPYVLDDATIGSDRVVKIPLRLHPGQPAPFRPEDVVLYDGDVVFIESRQTEFFYTGGLLGGGQYPIPRDFDLNVLEALALVDRIGSGRNRLDRQVSGPSATGLDVSISASELIVLRTLPDGREVPIKVDLYRAMTDPTERLLVAPGDYLFLKYTRSEAIGAWIERWLFDNVANGVNNSSLVTGNPN